MCEGLARELVRLVQDTRKSADFAITDLIKLVLQPHGSLDLTPVLAGYADSIRAETLASTLTTDTVPDEYFAIEVELETG